MKKNEVEICGGETLVSMSDVLGRPLTDEEKKKIERGA